MKLAIGVVRDRSAVEYLAESLLQQGGVADQLLVLTDINTELTDYSIQPAPSMLRVWSDPVMKLWSVREPHYFSGGIRDQRLTVQDAFTRIAVIESAGSVAQQSSRSKAVARHMPLVILQLNSDRQQARSHLNMLMKVALMQVEIVDSPAGESVGSFHFEQGSQD